MKQRYSAPTGETLQALTSSALAPAEPLIATG